MLGNTGIANWISKQQYGVSCEAQGPSGRLQSSEKVKRGPLPGVTCLLICITNPALSSRVSRFQRSLKIKRGQKDVIGVLGYQSPRGHCDVRSLRYYYMLYPPADVQRHFRSVSLIYARPIVIALQASSSTCASAVSDSQHSFLDALHLLA